MHHQAVFEIYTFEITATCPKRQRVNNTLKDRAAIMLWSKLSQLATPTEVVAKHPSNAFCMVSTCNITIHKPICIPVEDYAVLRPEGTVMGSAPNF